MSSKNFKDMIKSCMCTCDLKLKNEYHIILREQTQSFDKYDKYVYGKFQRYHLVCHSQQAENRRYYEHAASLAFNGAIYLNNVLGRDSEHMLSTSVVATHGNCLNRVSLIACLVILRTNYEGLQLFVDSVAQSRWNISISRYACLYCISAKCMP